MVERACLIGTGMIGGSLALALKQAGYVGHVVGCDVSAEVAERALAAGVVDEIADPQAAVREAQVVILAVPVRATARVCEAIAPALEPRALVTDVGSTKADVLMAVRQTLPHPDRFVGAHPIAGTERSGPEAADANLFRGRRCLITPTDTTRPEALVACEALWQAAGAYVERIDARVHDRVLALVSHLPHVAAFALASAVGEAARGEDEAARGVRGLSGGGFVDTTRVAASDAVMWRDVFLSNREAVLAAIERMDAELGELRRAIARGDGKAIEQLIARARAGRRRVIEGRG